MNEFLRYVGPWNLHDATIERLDQEGTTLRVRIRADDGEVISAEFHGVTQVIATAAEGMMLYALAEMRSDGPGRRFSFANWYGPGEEGSERRLDVMAEEVHFRSEGRDTRAV